MTALVTMRGNVSDWTSFRDAIDWYAGLDKPAGLHWSRSYRREGDESYVLMLEEWDSHDIWMEFADRIGEEFNKRANTEGLDWETFIWLPSDAKVID